MSSVLLETRLLPPAGLVEPVTFQQNATFNGKIITEVGAATPSNSSAIMLGGATTRAGIHYDGANTIGFSSGGGTKWYYDGNANFQIGMGVGGVGLYPQAVLQFGDGAGNISVNLGQEAANILSISNAANAQTLRVYGSTTGPKYLSLKHDGTNSLLISQTGRVILQGTGGGQVQVDSGGATDTTLYIITDTARFYLGASADVRFERQGANTIGINMGAATANFATIGGVANVNTTAVGNGADVTEDTLMTYSLPANSLSANGKAIRIRAWGTCAANADTKVIRTYFGATMMQASTDLGNNFNGANWQVEFIIVRTGAATQDWTGRTEVFNFTAINRQGTAAETLSGAVTVKCTGQAGVANANDIVQNGLLVEFMN